MTVPPNTAGRILLAGVPYQVAIDPQSHRPQWTVTVGPADERDTQPLLETVPFGNWGMGSSFPAVRNQCDYFLDVTAENWNELGPGLLQASLGLALANPILDMVTILDQNATRYLYIGAGNQLVKWRLSDFVQMGVHTFATGAIITDLCVLKSGVAPPSGTGVQGVAQPAGGLLLVAFGPTAPIAQIDAIGLAAGDTDTYHAQATPAAYAGVFAVALTEQNTKAQVWKSTAVLGQSTGAWCRLQRADVSPATGTPIDYTNATTWTPLSYDGTYADTNAYQVGDFGTSITSLVEYQNALVVAKPEGAFVFNRNASATVLYSTRAHVHPLNGWRMFPWGYLLIYPTSHDLEAVGSGDFPTIGMRTLVSNLSPIQGQVTAACGYGPDALFMSVYDGTDSYIVKLRRHRLLRTFYGLVPNDFVFYPVTRVPGHQVLNLLVSDDGGNSNVIRLYYDRAGATPGTYDVGYCILDPPAARQYAGGGVWYSTRQGSTRKKTFLRRLTFYSVGTTSASFITVQIAWDTDIDAGAFTTVGTITSPGRTVITFTPGVADHGYLYQIKLTWTLATATANPRLRSGSNAAAAQITEGGIEVLGQQQTDGPVTRFKAQLRLTDRPQLARGTYTREAIATAQAQLEALTDPDAWPVSLVYTDEWGVTTAYQATVQQVAHVMDIRDRERMPERVVEVTGLILKEVTA
jgi:hypothetical protein